MKILTAVSTELRTESFNNANDIRNIPKYKTPSLQAPTIKILRM